MPRYTIVALVRLEVAVSFEIDASDEEKAGEQADLVADKLGVKWTPLPMPGGLHVATRWQQTDQTATVESVDLF